MLVATDTWNTTTMITNKNNDLWEKQFYNWVKYLQIVTDFDIDIVFINVILNL